MSKTGGRFDFEDGGSYSGGWLEGKAHGHGVCTGPKGQGEYAGAWVRGFENSGVYTWPSGNTYSGEWQEGKRHGLGIEVRGHWVYRGEWSHGYKGRYGVRQSTLSCAKYEGTWTTNLQDGYGVETYIDEGAYQGQWQKGVRHGFGVRHSAPYGVAAQQQRRRRDLHSSMPSAINAAAVDDRRPPSQQLLHFLIDPPPHPPPPPQGTTTTASDRQRGGFVLTAKSATTTIRGGGLDEGGRSLAERLRLRKGQSTGDLPQAVRSQRRSSLTKGGGRGGGGGGGGGRHGGLSSSSSSLGGSADTGHGILGTNVDVIDPQAREVYMGEWKADKRSGFGVSERSDGLKYVGEWYNDKKQGYGVTTLRDGTKDEGKYKDNELVTSGHKRKLFTMGRTRLRDRVDAALVSATRAAEVAQQKALIAVNRRRNARERAEESDRAAAKALEDSALARREAVAYDEQAAADIVSHREFPAETETNPVPPGEEGGGGGGAGGGGGGGGGGHGSSSSCPDPAPEEEEEEEENGEGGGGGGGSSNGVSFGQEEVSGRRRRRTTEESSDSNRSSSLGGSSSVPTSPHPPPEQPPQSALAGGSENDPRAPALRRTSERPHRTPIRRRGDSDSASSDAVEAERAPVYTSGAPNGVPKTSPHATNLSRPVGTRGEEGFGEAKGKRSNTPDNRRYLESGHHKMNHVTKQKSPRNHLRQTETNSRDFSDSTESGPPTVTPTHSTDYHRPFPKILLRPPSPIYPLPGAREEDDDDPTPKESNHEPPLSVGRLPSSKTGATSVPVFRFDRRDEYSANAANEELLLLLRPKSGREKETSSAVAHDDYDRWRHFSRSSDHVSPPSNRFLLLHNREFHRQLPSQPPSPSPSPFDRRHLISASQGQLYAQSNRQRTPEENQRSPRRLLVHHQSVRRRETVPDALRHLPHQHHQQQLQQQQALSPTATASRSQVRSLEGRPLLRSAAAEEEEEEEEEALVFDPPPPPPQPIYGEGRWERRRMRRDPSPPPPPPPRPLRRFALEEAKGRRPMHEATTTAPTGRRREEEEEEGFYVATTPHKRRQEALLRREREEEGGRGNLVIRLADVTAWCTDNQLILVLVALNLSLAAIFFSFLSHGNSSSKN